MELQGDWQCVRCMTINEPELVNCTSCFARQTGAPKLTEELGHVTSSDKQTSFMDRIKSW